jgi:hypothetical protein
VLLLYCSNCGTYLEELANFCNKCGKKVERSPATESTNNTVNNGQTNTVSTPASHARIEENIDYPEEIEFYRRKFREFDSGGSGFLVTWNWPAFFFGAIWYLTKGMVTKAVIYIIIGGITGVISTAAGFPLFIFIPVFLGIAGNYDYYLLKKKGKQLW